MCCWECPGAGGGGGRGGQHRWLQVGVMLPGAVALGVVLQPEELTVTAQWSQRVWRDAGLGPAMEEQGQRALLHEHSRTAEMGFWLTLRIHCFKPFSHLCEGLALLLVETPLEMPELFKELPVTGHGCGTGLHGMALAPSKPSFPASSHPEMLGEGCK